MSRPPLRRATVEGLETFPKSGDPQREIEPHLVDLGGNPVVMRHGQGIAFAILQDGGADERLAIQIWRDPCPCGCNRPGQGMLATPDTAFAREFGRTLVREADRIDAAAATAAAAALAKAAGK